MTTSPETFQLSLAAAQAYEQKFVPALFADWAPPLVDLAGLVPGRRVLDVACGTGIVARTAADRLKGAGAVVGVDVNEAMLTVARGIRSDIEWRHGDVAKLPFADGSFDVALCQMALMFFPDRVGALREMRRVVTPGGTVAIVVPGRLESQPAYGPLVEIAARHAGPEALSLLGAYWTCGDIDELRSWFAAAGLPVTELRTRLGTATFPSIDDLVTTEVESTPLVERISAEVYRRIREEARSALAQFTTAGGTAAIPLEGHIVVARRSR
jgi:SAM-dependent methyltransferase